MEEKLNKLIEGVKEYNEKHSKLENSVGTIAADTKAALEKVKETLEPLVTEMQESKQKIKAQEESFKLMQQEFLANANGDNKESLEKAFKEYDKHLASYLKKNIPVPDDDVKRICADIAKKSTFGGHFDIDHQTKELVAGSNVDGGFFLTTDRSARISQRIFETSPMRAVANIETTTSDVYEIVLDDDEAAAGWVGEVSPRSETDTSTIGLVKIPIHELYANPKATQKMIDDAGFDIVSWHQGKVTRKMGRLENTAFVTGDGSEKPKGFLSYAAWASAGVYERNKVEQLETATATTIAGDDLIKLQGKLISDYGMMAQWAMNRSTLFNNIFTLKDTNGSYLINPRLIAEGGQLVLLGKPVNLFEDMADVANNSLSVAYADWKEFYTIVDRFGIRVLRDPFTAKPYVLFYTTKRVGGAVTNFEAGKILKTKSS